MWDGSSGRLILIVAALLAVPSPAAAAIVLGDGATPVSPAIIGPGGPSTDLDPFSIRATGTAETVTSVTVTLAPGTFGAIALVEVVTVANGTVVGSTSPAGDSVVVAITPLSVPKNTTVELMVRVTPKSHAAMPAPPGTEYAVTGTVTQVNGTAYSGDGTSTTVTIDNRSPSDATWGTITPGDAQIALGWTNPGDADLAQVVILRKPGSAVTDAPAEGASYGAGATIGSSTVAYAGTGTSFTDTGLTNGTSHYYAIFAKDSFGNYATGAGTGPHVPNAGETTTVGNGGDPASVTIAPGGAATMLDSFTLQTSAGTDTVTAVTVTLAAGTASRLGLVEIASDSGGTVHGAVTNPVSDAVSISLGPGVTATTTPIQYKVRVTPRSHAEMPAPPGASYAVTGTVTALASTNGKVYADTASATVTIDNQSPSDAAWGTITPSNAQIALGWSNPGDADFAGVVILRKAGGSITDAPAEGASYAAGATIGSSTVAYVGSGTSFTDTGLVNDTSYWYAIFAKDSSGNHAVGSQTGPHAPAGPKTTVGDGTNPADAGLCPGGAATQVDAFTLQTSVGTDVVTGATVTVASGAAAALGLVEITNDTGSTVHGAASNPASDAVSVSLGTSITATTGSTQYKVRITPRSHAAMPAPPGATHAVTGTVTAISSGNPKIYSDAASATITIDNQSPANATWGTVTAGNGQVALSWTNPPSDFSQVVILRKAGGQVTDYPGEGTSHTGGAVIGSSTVAYAGNGTSFTDSGLANGTSYHYEIFAKDPCGNYAPGASYGPVAPRAELSVSGTGQPAASNVTAGTVKKLVGKLTVSTIGGSVTITALRVASTGTALAGSDVQRLQLYDDTDGSGTITAGDTFLATSAWSSSLSRYVFGGLSYVASATARNLLVTLNAATGATATRTFAMQVGQADVSVNAPNVVNAFTVSGNTFTFQAGGTAGDPTPGSTKPAVAIVNPVDGAAVSGTFRVQARVHSPNGVPISSVVLSTDGGATFPIAMSRNVNYGTAPDSGVFEAQLSLAQGSYSLRAQASGSGSATSTLVPVTVNAARKGDGNLLVRDNSSQLCSDCHALQSHASETAGSKYGSWTTTCRDCHTSHGTSNIYLVKNQITPPPVAAYQGSKTIYFSNKNGYAAGGGAADKAAASYANSDNSGPCQVCHTRTAAPDGTPRYRNTGAADGHNASEACGSCHLHTTGFKAENKQCKDCHLTTTTDVDSYAWGDGQTARINDVEWNTWGHGSETNYPSGTGSARFSREGNGAGDLGCAYCHTSSSSHNDPQNYFRLVNLSYGVNGTCLVCHAKKLNGNPPPGFDPDGADADYASIVSSKRVDLDHAAGPGHQAPDESGGNFCWDCHDPHGDKSQSGAVVYFMLQNKLVERNVAATSSTQPYGSMWGTPQAGGFAAAYEFNPAIYGDTSTFEFQDYYLGGLCTRCHDQENIPAGTGVKYYYKTGSYTGTPPHDGGGSLRNRCSDCHVHPIGCGGCHNAPPTSGVHDRHNQRIAEEQVVNYTATTPEATPALYGFRCVKCHNGTHANQASDPVLGKSSANPYQVQLEFESATDPRNPKPPAAYTRSGAWTSYQGGNGEWWGWTPAGSCASVYCHSNGAPADVPAAYAPGITWQPQTGWDCTKCHGSAASTSTMSVAHALHAGSTSYAYGCERCHSAVVTDSTTLSTAAGGGKMLHVNGLKNVAFDGTFSQSAGTYDGAGRTCSNTYCHSSGTDRNGADGYVSEPSVAWTTTGAVTCRYCHGGDATETPTIGTSPDPGTPMHQKHVNNAPVIGTNFGCPSCHDTVVSGNTTISNRANHVNQAANVAFAAVGSFTGGSYASGTCSSVYCHSSGQATGPGTPVYTSPSWTGAALGCNGCHGPASTYGEPSYANGGAGAATANSHAKHVSGSASCADCHDDTTATGTSILSGSTRHINGTREVAIAAAHDDNGGTKYDNYTAGTKTCSSVRCHGAGTPQWGGAVSCLGCHGTTAAETDDFGPSFWSNGVPATINTTEWTYSGHGKTSGTFDVTGNAAPAFPTAPTPGTSQCRYCHDETVAHGVSTNPYRLRNTGGADGQNGNCLACHKTGSAGVTPSGQTARNSTKKVDAAHDGAKHTAATAGGKFCWDCHDPHGDRPSNTNNSGYNILMIRSQVFAVNDGTYGYLGASGVARSVELYDRVAAANSPSPVGRIVESTTALGTAHKGLCQACHNPTTAGTWTKYWENTGHDDPDGPGGTAAYKSGVTTGAHHNTTTYCASCHPHTAKFAAGGGGDCRGCHGTSTQGSRRAVDADFTKQSHHVGSGTANMGGALTNFDCVVCHSEGTVDAGPPRATNTDPALHMNGRIDLRNADNAAASFAYDKDAVAASAGAAANWNSGNAEWRTQTSTNLDPFCLSCHDSNGASASYTLGDTGAAATNPFADARITNEYDQNIRCDLAPATPGGKPPCTAPGRIVDIKSKVTGAPPPQGTFARHAIRGQSTSIYGSYTALGGSYLSMYEYGGFTSMGTDEGGKPNWNDTSVMGCADCHTGDGANGTAGNAHGSGSEYMLKDSTGGAAEGTKASLNYVCYRCHATAMYQGTPHTGNGGDWQDYTSQTGTGRVPFGNTGGNWAAYACGNCHGTAQFGGIHGTSLVLGVGQNGGSGTRNTYRFTNGASMRYYDPQGWSGTSATCYTLGGGETSWAGCTKHGGGQGRSKPFSRPLSY